MTPYEQATDWTPRQAENLLISLDYAPTNVVLLGSGQWSDCFGFADHERSLVVRIGRHIEDFKKDEFAGRFAQPGLPVPAVHKVGRHDDHCFAISDRVFGTPLEHSPDWGSLVAPLVDLLEALRTADITGCVGWGPWVDGQAPCPTWADYLLKVADDPPGTRVHGWKDKLENYPRAASRFADGYRLLGEIIVENVPRSLVHNDLYHRNVFTTHGHITGVFDWGISLFGDHLYDLGLLCFWSPWFDDDIDEQPVIAELRARWDALGSDPVPNFGDRLRVCLLHIGLQHLAYNAFLERSADVDPVADRMMKVVEIDW